MLFVAQVYAPVDRHRTLYVWSCAAPTCSRQPCWCVCAEAPSCCPPARRHTHALIPNSPFAPQSWHIVRQQAPFGPDKEEAATPAAPAPSAADSAAGGFDVADTASMWMGGSGESATEAGGATSSFLSAAGLGDDFEQLLSLQETRTSDTVATPTPSAANAVRKPAVLGTRVSRPDAAPPLPCRTIRTEDWGADDGAGGWHIPASEAGHIQELERTYVEHNGEIPTTTSAAGAGAGANGGEVEEYEATPPAVKAMLRFQQAVHAQPRQVLRCDHAGQRPRHSLPHTPLWLCRAQIPLRSRAAVVVPPAQAGAQRPTGRGPHCLWRPPRFLGRGCGSAAACEAGGRGRRAWLRGCVGAGRGGGGGATRRGRGASGRGAGLRVRQSARL